MDKICGRVAQNEVAILLQNVDGDVEGYVIGCHVGIFDNIVSDTEEDILLGCVAV